MTITTIEGVEEREDGYVLRFDRCWLVLCPRMPGVAAPRVGELLLMGGGNGHEVTDVVVGGRAFRAERLVLG